MKNSLLLLLSMTALSCLGQNISFLPGYIITAVGDTVRGNIKYANWEKNPRKIEFQQDGKEVAILSFSDITVFEIIGKDSYEKANVVKSGRPIDFNQLNDPLPRSILRDTVFLRMLVKGPISLYELVDKRKYYFIGEGDGEIKELEHWLEPQAATGDFYTRNTYQDQLLYLVSGSPSYDKIKNRIMRLTYTEKKLSDIVGQINLLKGGKASTWKPVQQNGTYFFVGSGINVAQLNFGGTPSAEFSTLKYTKSVIPSFRVGMDYASGRGSQRLIFRVEFDYNTWKFSGNSNIDKGSAFERNIQYDLHFKMISPAINVLYIVSKHRLNPYLGLGVTLNFTSNTNTHISNYIDGRKTVIDPYLLFENRWLGINGKAGMMINKKFDLNINVNLGGGFLHHPFFKAGANVLGLQVNYRFQRSSKK